MVGLPIYVATFKHYVYTALNAYACINTSPRIQSLLMSENIDKSTRIDDLGVAWDVAHSAKDERSMAAAIRHIDGIVKGFSDVADGTDAKRHMEFTAKIMGAYAIYPEVFVEQFKTGKHVQSLTTSEAAAAASVIARQGGLPFKSLSDVKEDNSADRYDRDAEIIENATEALLVRPPSQDFLRDHDLGRNTYLGNMRQGYEYRVTVKEVTELLASADYFVAKRQGIVSDVTCVSNMYEQFDNRGFDGRSDRLQFILNSLDRAAVYRIGKGRDEEFNKKVLAAKNSEDTTIGQLWELYQSGTAEAIKQLEEAEASARAIYSDVVTGSAATYTSPAEAETTN